MIAKLILRRALAILFKEFMDAATTTITLENCQRAVDRAFAVTRNLAARTATSLDDVAVAFVESRVDKGALAQRLHDIAKQILNDLS